MQTTQLVGLCALLEFQKGVLHKFFTSYVWRGHALSPMVGLADVQKMFLSFPGVVLTEAGASRWHKSGKHRPLASGFPGSPAAGKAEQPVRYIL